MKKILIISLCAVLVLAFTFVACSKNSDQTNGTTTTANSGETVNENGETTQTTADGLDAADNEYGFETEVVTDKNGKEVTNKSGEKVTTDVAVAYHTDAKGNTYAQKIDDDGNEVTDKKGNPVTLKETTTAKNTNTKAAKTSKTSGKADSSISKSNSTTAKGETTKLTAESTKSSGNETTKTGSTATTKKNSAVTTTKKNEKNTEATTESTTEKVTATTNKNAEVTKTSDTTKFEGNESVPKTSATGKEVSFSTGDMETIADMLEVPYLYLTSYENSEGVPINIAAYTAVWMAQHDGGTGETYPSSPVVLNLFKFYGQTVVNFKTKVNDVKDTPIKYNTKNDTFTVSTYPEKKQTVKITKIEDLGDNNFYKVTADVSGAGKIKKVYAIIQKNKLDSTLGFSVKALNWK